MNFYFFSVFDGCDFASSGHSVFIYNFLTTFNIFYNSEVTLTAYDSQLTFLILSDFRRKQIVVKYIGGKNGGESFNSFKKSIMFSSL